MPGLFFGETMSHITDLKQTTLIAKDKVFCLSRAVENYCPELEFVEGQNHFRTWKDDHEGRLVGDWPLPQGMTEAEVGNNAHHTIQVTDQALKDKFGKSSRHEVGAPYEIGLVPVKAEADEHGKPITVEYAPEGEHTHYALMTDFYGQAAGLMNCQGVGKHRQVKDPETGKMKQESFGDLFMHFQMEVAKAEAERRGDEIEFQKLPDGTYTAEVQTVASMGMP